MRPAEDDPQAALLDEETILFDFPQRDIILVGHAIADCAETDLRPQIPR